jgi:hypothetical protein
VGARDFYPKKEQAMRIGELASYASKYLKAKDLMGHSARVTIEEVTVEQLYNKREREHQQWAVLWFKGKQKGLVLNKTRFNNMVDIFGTDESSEWVGQEIILTPTRISGKDTIVIGKPQEAGNG